MTSQVQGTADVARAFDELGRRVQDATAVGQELADTGLDAAQRAAPVREGVLLASLSTEVGQATADLGTDVGYAPFPEFGTPTMAAWRFIGAGYDAMNERAEAVATAWLEGVLADVDAMA